MANFFNNNKKELNFITNCSFSIGDLSFVEKISKKNFFESSWFINNYNEYLTNAYSPIIFIIGSYKTGKSTIINKITKTNVCDVNSVENTQGENICIFKNNDNNQNYVFIDTEGFYQPNLTIKNDIVMEFVMTHLSKSCNCLIFVVEKLFEHELRQLKEIINLYNKTKEITSLFIIHNLKGCSKKEDLLKIKKEMSVLFKCESNSNDNNNDLSFLHVDKEKVINHYIIGNYNYLSTLNDSVVDKIRNKIIQGNYVFVKEPLITGFHISIKNTLYKYCSFDDDYEICSNIYSSNDKIKQLKFYGSKDVNNIRHDIVKKDVWKRIPIEIFQKIDDNYLYIFIECPGLIKNAFNDKPFQIEYHDDILLIHCKKYDYQSNNELNIFEKITLLEKIVIIESEKQKTYDTMKLDERNVGVIILRLNK